MIAIFLSLTTASPALALDLNPADYFQFAFNPVSFDKSEVAVGEAFHVTITGSAACTQDLPLPISEITITSQVVARQAGGGADLILNPEYVISIKPLPNKAGEAFNINQTVSLRFPTGAAPGNYSVTGLLTEAKVTVKVVFSYTLDVTGSFPKEQTMGMVKCIVPSTATAPATTQTGIATAPPAITMPTITATALPGINPGGPPPQPQTATSFNTYLMIAVIVIGIIAIALAAIVILLLRRRGM